MSASATSKIGWRRRSGANWRRLGNEKASAGSGGIGRGCTTLSGCSTAIECDTTDRKRPQPDRSHKPWREANGSAQCGKSACCVRRGGDWKRGTVERPAGAPVRGKMGLLERRAHGRPNNAGDAGRGTVATFNDRRTPAGTSSPRQCRRSGPTVSWYGRLLIIGTLLVAAGSEIFRLLLAVLTLD